MSLKRFFSLLSGISGRFRGSTDAMEEVDQLTPSPSSPTTGGSEFEVFLSFRGEDTRKGFTGHLYDDLKQRGVSTFKDDKKLEKGEHINKLFEYIKKSKIFVPIFSKRYAESKWCLKEVVEGVECGKDIVPVFFGVEPSDVRYQSGPFKSAFRKHESNKQQDQEEVRKWREALSKVANLSGFTLKELNWDEAKLRRAVIKRVLDRVNTQPLEVAKHPIGIETRVQDVKKMLENEGNVNGVHVVGIHGMGGLGKTTIAKAVYNDLAQGFDGATCFLSNIREKSGQTDGFVDLQKKVFREIFKDKNILLSDVAHGVSLIKERARRKRILLILDDVDSVEQLNALAGGRYWFGSGSVIIITTRDEQALLAHNLKQHEIYKPPELNDAQSRELFTRHAFNGEQPQEEFVTLTNEVVRAAGGLPLTLEVLGSLLSSKKNVQEWKDTLEKLKKIPPSKVQQRLKLSYDSLDDLEKKIFLDVSCFFIGGGREYATYMWKDCGWFPNVAIGVLVQRSLIKIDEKHQQFEIHDQIRDMGRAIVEEECSRKPEKQSRHWISEDSLNLLQQKAVLRAIDAEGIQISREEDCDVSVECFENMPNLRYFSANHLNFQGTSRCCPCDLKWLHLNSCHFDSPPSNFNFDTVSVLELHRTNMVQILTNQLPLRFMVFKNLKVLSVHHADIKITPNFTNFPSLVKMELMYCSALTTIDESIGELKNLTYLCIGGCEILESLPDSVGRLNSVEVLNINLCSTIAFLPEQLGDMQSLRQLDLNQTNIVNIAESIGQLTNLRELLVYSCQRLSTLPNSICQLSSLEILNAEKCIGLASLPEQLGGMRSLRHLDLKETSIVSLPDSIGQLIKLRELLLGQCQKLARLPDSICQLSSLEVLDIDGCSTITFLPEQLGDMQSLRQLSLSGTGISSIPDSIGQLTNLHELWVKTCRRLSRLPDSIFRLSSLEILNVDGCIRVDALPEQLGDMQSLGRLHIGETNIVSIPDSIGQLTNLRQLDMKLCKRLSRLPDSICQLSSLEMLDLGQCTNLSSLPKGLGAMKSLWDLDLSRTCIEVIPDSIGQLTNLRQLSLTYVESLSQLPDTICNLSLLTSLGLRGCSGLRALPERLGDMENLEFLSLDKTRIKVIPDSVGQSSLQHLHKDAITIREFEGSSSELLGLTDKSRKAIERLHLNDAVIEELPDCVGGMENLERLVLECEMLTKLPGSIERYEKLSHLEIRSKHLKALPDCIGSLKLLWNLILKCENLKALPNSIGSLKQMQRLELNCVNLEALPDSIVELGNIYFLVIESAKWKALPSSITLLGSLSYLELCCVSLEALPASIGMLKWLWNLKLKCPNLEKVPDSIGELERLEYFTMESHGLTSLPNSIGSLKRLKKLQLNCPNLESLPDSMGTLESLETLGLHCDTFTTLPDFIGRLESLTCFSFKSKNLKHMPVTIHQSMGRRLESLSLSGCENLEDLAEASIQQTGLTHFSSLKYLDLEGCKRLEYLPQLPPSLRHLNTSGCISLLKMSNVSFLEELKYLNLDGCKMLEDVPGLESISNNLVELILPGPCDHFMLCCHLTHDFKSKVFEEMTFGGLEKYKTSGCVARGSVTGQQQLHFMLPRMSFSWLRRARLTLGLDKVISPVHIAIMADDTLMFQKIVEFMEGTDKLDLNLREESMEKTWEGEGEHCYIVQVTTDVCQLQSVWAGLQHPLFDKKPFMMSMFGMQFEFPLPKQMLIL